MRRRVSPVSSVSCRSSDEGTTRSFFDCNWRSSSWARLTRERPLLISNSCSEKKWRRRHDPHAGMHIPARVDDGWVLTHPHRAQTDHRPGLRPTYKSLIQNARAVFALPCGLAWSDSYQWGYMTYVVREACSALASHTSAQSVPGVLGKSTRTCRGPLWCSCFFSRRARAKANIWPSKSAWASLSA